MTADTSRLVSAARPIAPLPPEREVGSAIRAFYGAVRNYYPDDATVDGRLAVIMRGVEFLAAARAWWAEYRR